MASFAHDPAPEGQPTDPLPHLTPTDQGGHAPAGRPPASTESGRNRPTLAGPDTPPTGTGLPSPPRFGHYELLEELARGGMGVVYKARDPALGRIVALKAIRPDVVGQGPEYVQRFCHEARVVAQLRHPNIVPIHEFGEHDGHHYFAMTYVGGGSLEHHLDRFLGQPRQAAALVEKIARAVHHAHEKGILHRDLKPANVLLDEHDEPLVSDFGLAKWRDADVELTQPGQMMGTPAYMAPEQTGGASAKVDAPTDVWALGVLLYWLLTGHRPFKGNDREETLHHVRQSEPPRPRTLQPALDRQLEVITLKCLEKDPPRRYPSAAALADDLARWLRGEPILARPEGMGRRAYRWLRRHPTLSACTALLAVFLAFTAFWIPRVEEKTEEEPPLAHLQQLQQQLAEGRPVELVGANGLPRWYRWRMDKNRLNQLGAEDSPLTLATESTALLELLPDPILPRYRFRAEVRTRLGSDVKGVGIYLGYQERPTPEGLEHVLTALSAVEGGPSNHVALEMVRCREATALSDSFLTRVGGGVSQKLPPSLQRERQWHQLAIDVTPEELAVFWEREPIGKVRRDSLDDRARYLLGLEPKFPDSPAAFAPRGGLGLFLREASASFRRVWLEPLP